ncbi:unnamed protein product [Candidula unifasciata]|uniref:Uncharacterized protein n=1 Tax=Candidula unifasciata TaxID=100452 RepID=A0A8S3Z3J4_9EUPU|nr:unnamed protein product [Candidula unifasciata]
MYLAVVLAFITACAFSEVAAQMADSPLRWNQLCDETLVLCTQAYEKGVKNKETINWYYHCVFRIQCERWSEGFYNRQNILSKIQARKEFYDPNTEWWKNGGCKRRISLACIPLLLFIHRILRALLQ